MRTTYSKDLLATLISLLADQEIVEIKYQIQERRDNECA